MKTLFDEVDAEAAGYQDHGAAFSDCRVYRYALWRLWGAGPYAAFIGLNPSTADEAKDDPTIRRCIRFARDWGCKGLYMLNIFAFCATDPKAMKAAVDPIGPGNDQALLRYCSDPATRIIVAAWGEHGKHVQRGAAVQNILRGFRLKCLGKNQSGAPKHPLYVPANFEPVEL